MVEANVAYPTDVGLLAHAISKTARLVSRVKAAGGATRTGYRDRSRATRRRLRAITYQLRHYRLRRRGEQATEQTHAALTRTTAQLAGLAEAGTAEAIAVLRNARRACRRATARRRGRLRRATSELATTIEITTRVVAQARIRVAGGTPAAASRIVSLHDPDARPIVKGRLDKPVEFGYKAQILDNADGVIVDHTVEAGNPPDAPGLAPAIARVAARCGKVPRAVTADTNYGEQAVVDDLHTLGVSTVAIPRKGRPDTTGHAREHRRAFRKLLRWRAGCEGRVSCLKRDYGWGCSRLDGLSGARTWCGYGVLTHNLIKVGNLAAVP